MKVLVDFDTCESHGTCVELAPQIFELKNASLVLLDPTPDCSQREALEAAERSCPTGSIFLIDDPEDQGVALDE